MRRSLVTTTVMVLVSAVTLVLGSSPASPAPPPGRDRLDVYSAQVTTTELSDLARQGFDVTASPGGRGDQRRLSLVLTPAEAGRLRAQGVDLTLTRVKGGLTVREFAAKQAAGGYRVWRSYDGPDGIRDQLRTAARRHPGLVKLSRLGTTYQGRQILAVKVTQGARRHADGARPAVLYSSTQHAREWISTEVNRRLLFHIIKGWRSHDPGVRRLLRTTELWFLLVANPDGYEYTFEHERLWRKNLRDNDRNGLITVADGVDPNRNFPNHWGYDEEGSSSIPSSVVYRGPSPASEPETKAMMKLLKRSGSEFQVNYHSFGQWLLYPEGWQIATPTADDPIYYALSGNLDHPAIEGFHPGLGSDVLYVTNGDTNDYAHAHGTLSWTPELSEGCEDCGFVFPDDPALVRAEFRRNLPFAMSVARSAADPDDPDTVTGIPTKPFYLRSADPYKRGVPGVDLTFSQSYGDPQPVAVLAKRSLGPVTVRYRINGGQVRSAPTSEWDGGERYDPAAVYYHQVRGMVRGTDPGDTVEVWFTAHGRKSKSFHYEAVSETRNRVLVVAAEDYTGASPEQTTGPHYAQAHLDAIAAAGEDADLYDVDAAGRRAPDALGVLSHYDAVVWYTGDDVVTRTLGREPGNVDRLALDEILEMRSYMNEGGRVMYSGNWAGQQFTGTVGDQLYDPKGRVACEPLPDDIDPRRCLALRGSGDGVNDVLQYYFGGYLSVLGDGVAEDGTTFGLQGVDTPYEGLEWTLNGAGSADNQDATSSFVATSGLLPVEDYPQFASHPAAVWDKPGGPFEPHTGDQYVYSQIADVSYKRLTREIEVPAGGGDLSFWTSYSTELDWDYFFVEARTPGAEDWTTLPDLNGHTSQGTGESCPEGWAELHPQLSHYQTEQSDGTCSPTGTSGEWNAATGDSGGWQEWRVDLAPWAGETVEISLTYVSDWSTQNLGVFLDDVTLPDGTATSFEDSLDGWTVAEPPAGSAPNANTWERTDASGFPVGAVIATPDSLLMGFGLEGVSTAEQREAVMRRALQHLLG